MWEFTIEDYSLYLRVAFTANTATKDEATKEKFREATLSGTKVADSFAVFVKAASQQALPPGEQ